MFHSFRVLVKKIVLIGIADTIPMFIYLMLWYERVTRVGRAMYSGILTLILLFTILYMVISRAILRLSSSKCQFKSFRGLVSVPGSRS